MIFAMTYLRRSVWLETNWLRGAPYSSRPEMAPADSHGHAIRGQVGDPAPRVAEACAGSYRRRWAWWIPDVVVVDSSGGPKAVTGKFPQ